MQDDDRTVARSRSESDRGRLWRSKPTQAAPLLLALTLGVLAGVGGYTFSYAKGLSYLSHDPRACVNCHVMQGQYDSWQKSGHHHVAVCIDCHLPHDFFGKWLVKSENGWRHSKLFTTGNFEQPITIKAGGRAVLQESCIHCHSSLTADMRSVAGHAGDLECTHCHADVGHGPRAGLGGPMTEMERRGLAASGEAKHGE